MLGCLFAGLVSSSGAAAPSSFTEFKASAVAGAAVPPSLSEPLRAMWLARSGQWEPAHKIAQDIDTPTGSWIHGFLHREEGDLGNAGYWYRRAGMTMPTGVEIAEEWLWIAKELWQREKGVTPGEEIFTSASGLVASSEKSASGEEGTWDTLIRKDGKAVVKIENARPVSFSPTGDVLLLVDAAADDDCRHFLVKPMADVKVPPFGNRASIGGRFTAGHKWSDDGKSVTLIPDGQLSDPKPETFEVATHLSPK
ncbi:MAG: hypothetical protein ACRDBP_19075 [Luteolibacter sp.]